jgi:hypothetical protein
MHNLLSLLWHSLGILGITLLLFGATPANSFEFQRMLLPRQTIELPGEENSTAEVASRCLDYYRRTPEGGTSPDKYTYVVPQLGNVVVRVGDQTMSLQDALTGQKVEIIGDGSYSSLLVRKLVADTVTITVAKPSVVTEGRSDDAEELAGFFASHAQEWAAEPPIRRPENHDAMVRQYKAQEKLQNKLWSERDQQMKTYLKQLKMEHLVSLINQQQKIAKQEQEELVRSELPMARKPGVKDAELKKMKNERISYPQHAASELLSVADYAGIAVKAAARLGKNTPIVVHIFRDNSNSGLYGVAFFPNNKVILLRPANAADQLVEERRALNNDAPILLVGPSDQRPDYQALELSIRAALAEKAETWITADDVRADDLFPNFANLPTNRGGNFNRSNDGGASLSNLATSPKGQPVLLAIVSRSKTTITAAVRKWRVQFESVSTWAASQAAKFGVSWLSSGGDGSSAQQRKEIYDDLIEVVYEALSSDLQSADRSEVSVSARYGASEIFARRVVDDGISTLSPRYVMFEMLK